MQAKIRRHTMKVYKQFDHLPCRAIKSGHLINAGCFYGFPCIYKE